MCMVRDSSGCISQRVLIKVTQQILDAAQQRPLVLSVPNTLPWHHRKQSGSLADSISLSAGECWKCAQDVTTLVSQKKIREMLVLRSSGPIQLDKPFLFFSCQKKLLVHFFPTCVTPNTEKSTTEADLVGTTQAEPRTKAQVIFLSSVTRDFCRSPWF